MNKRTKEAVLKELERLYPDARPALKFDSAYELLVAVVLSAQCTDARVNKVTEQLFKEHNTPQTMLTLGQEALERYIFSCGLYHSKAKHILSASADIVEKFDGQVPSTIRELKTLSGVGQKTANVVYSVWFGGDAIAVDTHVFRVSNRLGLAKADNVLKTEEDLHKSIPKSEWSKAHHWLIFHGRKVCRSQRPECEICTLSSLCDYYKKKTSRE